MNSESFGAEDGLLCVFVRERNEPREVMENSCIHGFHTRHFGKITALRDALFLSIQESTGFPTLLLLCCQCSSEPQCKEGGGPLGNKRTRRLFKESRAS